MVQPEQQRRRHARKHTEGKLEEDRGFYFRFRDVAWSVGVQNLSLFPQIAVGAHDRIWPHHLRAGDYSAGICGAIKDENLAGEVAAVELVRRLSAADN